jgi:hypothetical protein
MAEIVDDRDIFSRIVSLRSWLIGKWSPLCLIVENTPGKRWNDICRPDGPAVYRLVALNANVPGIVPAALDRICGVDPTGTLYIGKSRGSLRSRLASLVKTNLTGSGGSGGHRTMVRKLARQFAPRWRAISWQMLVSADAATNRERELLRAYEERFGDLPPLNRSGA